MNVNLFIGNTGTIEQAEFGTLGTWSDKSSEKVEFRLS